MLVAGPKDSLAAPTQQAAQADGVDMHAPGLGRPQFSSFRVLESHTGNHVGASELSPANPEPDDHVATGGRSRSVKDTF